MRNCPNRCEVQNVVGEVTQPAMWRVDRCFSHCCLSPHGGVGGGWWVGGGNTQSRRLGWGWRSRLFNKVPATEALAPWTHLGGY